MIWSCSLFFIKVLLAQILITFRSIQDCISDHLSLSNSDSVSLSSCNISGCILVSLGSDLAFYCSHLKLFTLLDWFYGLLKKDQ